MYAMVTSQEQTKQRENVVQKVQRSGPPVEIEHETTLVGGLPIRDVTFPKTLDRPPRHFTLGTIVHRNWLDG
jgi:hypothetical protein